MKNVKTLLVITLAFALFMVCGTVKANQGGPGARCNSENCSIKIEKVAPGTAVVIDPELLTLSEDENLFAISVATNDPDVEYDSPEMTFSIAEYGDYNIKDAIIGYVPNSLAGHYNNKYSRVNAMLIHQGTELSINNDFSVVGYLVVNEEYADAEFEVAFVEDYSNWNSMDVTLNGIEYTAGNDSDAINTDILFGDFRFNYIVTDEYNGYFAPVNSNSDKIVIDNSNSVSDIYSQFDFYKNANVGMFFDEYEPFTGDRAGGYEQNGPVDFEIDSHEKKTIRAELFGGDPSTAKEILKDNGLIGRISLLITNDPEKLG